jgi:hypothetical protein
MEKVLAENLVKQVFEKINNSKSVEQLLDIINLDEIVNYRIDVGKYPKLNLNITIDELNKLSDLGYIKDSKINISAIDFEKESTLTKLLYSVLWKNGDLGKEKHIISGIKNSTKEDEKALVFYYFGRHIADSSKNKPIIDQHTLRAFGIYLCATNQIKKVEKNIRKNKSKIILSTEYFLNLNTTSFREIPLIIEYENWIESHHLRNQADFTYNIDLVLFALGKSIKNQK